MLQRKAGPMGICWDFLLINNLAVFVKKHYILVGSGFDYALMSQIF
jgi:hypothetical protein